ncbi:MAG: YkoF family thiamine/hydroxymethylpyrimidine-binding protein [Steroidobacteraceae bacterium]
MDIGVEVSLYPLTADFIPPIADFIARVNRHTGLKVVTNSLSTQIFGPYEAVMRVLHAEIRPTFESGAKAVFVMKVIGPYAGG